MAVQTNCFDIVLNIADANSLPVNKEIRYEFIDHVINKTWTFTLIKEVDDPRNELDITLEIDYERELKIKLDIFWDYENIGSFDKIKNKSGEIKWKCCGINADVCFEEPSMNLLLKCELRVPSNTVEYHPKMDKFLKSELFSDVKLISSDEVTFFGHRIILSAVSRIFNRLLIPSSDQSGKQEITLGDVDAKTLENVLHFIYTGEVDHIDIDEYDSLINAAFKYEITELMKTCVKRLDENYEIYNVMDVLILAVKYKETALMENCLKFINFYYDEDGREKIRKSKIDAEISVLIMDELRNAEKFPSYELKLKP